jgi:rare lipoprotein A
MSVIALVPKPIAKRSSLVLACGALLSSMLFASTNAEAGDRRARSKSPPARAEANGGNPEFYDVFGKRYRVRASSDGYRERGTASWYGRPFHGRPTSTGEMYDMHEMTAAHTTLPLPTWAEVTNLANGKSIIVKINDRGPFVGKRVIDLSYAAANALDLVQAGTGRVEVRALPGPPPETTANRRASRDQKATVAKASVKATDEKPIKAADGPVKTANRLFAEAGKFRERNDAVDLVDSLKAQGFLNAFVVTEDGRRKSLHRVRVGPLLDAAEVEDMSDRLRGLGAKRSRSVVMP